MTANSDNTITVHDCRMHNDMKRQYINHNSFTFDRVFDETVTNTQVYENTAKQLVDITIRGGYSTCLMYGQTGSGKTFTMTSIIKSAASDIFSRINDTTERFEESPLVSVSYVEVAGERCSDLLNEFSPAQLLTAPDGTVHPFPVVEPTVTTEEELLALIQHGINVRTTAATGVHDASSRSHSILRVYIQSRKKSGEVVEGTMTLVDLAGSEHRIDSMLVL